MPYAQYGYGQPERAPLLLHRTTTRRMEGGTVVAQAIRAAQALPPAAAHALRLSPRQTVAPGRDITHIAPTTNRRR